jgi:hypothetical protein
MVCRVADQCRRLPGVAAKLRVALPLDSRFDHDWRGLAVQVIRLDELVDAGVIKLRAVNNPAGYLVSMLTQHRSSKPSAAELDALYAKVERLGKSEAGPPARLRKEPAPQPRPDDAARITDLERALPGLEAAVAAATNPGQKGVARLARDQAREELAALKNARHGEGQSHLAFSATH